MVLSTLLFIPLAWCAAVTTVFGVILFVAWVAGGAKNYFKKR